MQCFDRRTLLVVVAALIWSSVNARQIFAINSECTSCSYYTTHVCISPFLYNERLVNSIEKQISSRFLCLSLYISYYSFNKFLHSNETNIWMKGYKNEEEDSLLHIFWIVSAHANLFLLKLTSDLCLCCCIKTDFIDCNWFQISTMLKWEPART